MIYTTDQINQVLSKAYCCIGELGDKINSSMIGGLEYKCKESKLKNLFMFTFLLVNFKQSSDGLTIDDTNYITIDQRDKCMEYIISNCACTGTIDVTLNPYYWLVGYTNDDTSEDSYIE